jgi:hypothetical protein
MSEKKRRDILFITATLYNNTFPTHGKYREFTINRLTMWGNILDYKLFDTLYMTHRYHSHTIKKLWEQPMALLKEANNINEQDMMVRHEIESHVKAISRSDLQQQIKSHNELESWFLPHPFPLHLDNQTVLIEQLIDKTTLDANTSVLNAETPLISNGIAPFTSVELVIK